MPRTTRTITFSLPPEMSDRLDAMSRRDDRTRSAFIREALARYIEDREWREVLEYGEQRAREAGIEPEDVSRLIAEYRAETYNGGV
ncbi:MAG: ribbon-helix-helix protein, CopG family [Chloroflexi bacterium]|nr:ribbon-helix-helix protein, CopG family [Chloroflexota bacterium]